MKQKYTSQINLPTFSDIRGKLQAGQWPDQLPFIVKRFFVVSNVPKGESRGIHAHRECHQLLLCLAGSLKATVDDGKSRTTFTLDQVSPAIHMPPLTWGTQYDYSEDAILLVLASEEYIPEDYINDYQEFLAIIKSRNQ